DRRRVTDACQRAAAARQHFRIEYQAIAADGRLVWLAMVVRVRPYPDGSAQLHGLLLDISESKRAAELQQLVGKLEESEAMLREKNEELEKFHDIVVDRELTMIRLEREVERLRRKLNMLT